jgi:Actinobacteria/chloroflexi VLRF1 release factor
VPGTRNIGRANLRKRLEPLEGSEGHSSYRGGRATFTRRDGSLAVRPPFGLAHEAEYDRIHVAPLLAALEQDHLVGALLVRLGGFAVGVFEGERLVASKVGTRNVHGRHRAGGSSANRFRRRREQQARELVEAAAAEADRVLGPHVAALEALALGGDRSAARHALAAARRLAPLEPRVLPRFFDVPDPRRAVLERLPYDLYAAEVAVT